MLPEDHANIAGKDLTNKTVAVTGATDGVGREAAISFGRLGATVIVIGRTSKKANAVVDRIHAYGGTAVPHTADFSTMSAVKQLSRDIENEIKKIDILVNNAGAIFPTETFTPDGLEKTAAINYFSAYQLTYCLRGCLKKSDDPHVVNVSSNGHRFSNIDLDRFKYPTDYSAFGAYNHAKLALICFSNELARRSDQIRSNSLHPGFVPDSSFYRRFPSVFNKLLPLLHYLPRTLIRRPIVTTAEAAGTILHASVQEGTGNYYEEQEQIKPSEDTADATLRGHLWEFTADRLDVPPAWP